MTRSNFRIDASGVYYVDDREEVETLLCSPLYVDAETRDEHGDNWGRLLRWSDPEGKLHTMTMPVAMLAGEATVVRERLMAGGLQISCTRRAKEKLPEYLMQPAGRRIRNCSQIGWYNGCFVLPDETFAPAGAEEVKLQVSMCSSFGGLTTTGTLDGWRETIGAWCVGNSRLAFGVSMGFAGPLLELATEQGGAVHIVGSTSDGKTTVERACCSVMGAPRMMQTWRGTLNGLEGAAWAHNHLTLCLDEIAQINATDAAEIAYLLANGQGKARADQTGAARPSARWLLLVLSTGEETLSNHAATVGKSLRGGAEVRFVNVASDTGSGHKAFENLHGAQDGAAFSQMIKEAAATHYGHPLRHFLRWLVNKRAEVQQDLRGAIDSFVEDNAADASAEVKRAAKRFALIGAAGELATEAGITGWPEGEAMSAARRCFESYLELRGTLGESDTEKAVRNVFAFIEQHGGSRFQDMKAPREQRVFNRAGFMRSTDHGDEYLFLPETFRTEVCKGSDHKKVAQALKERGFLRHGSDRLTKKERLPGMGATNVYVVLLRRDEPEEQLADAA